MIVCLVFLCIPAKPKKQPNVTVVVNLEQSPSPSQALVVQDMYDKVEVTNYDLERLQNYREAQAIAVNEQFKKILNQ